MELKTIKISEIELLQDLKKIEDWEKRKFLKSIKKYGIVSPVVVTKRDNKYICIDGNLRIKFAKELGYKTIKAIVIDIPDEKIKRARTLLNTIKFPTDSIRLGMILREFDMDLKDTLMIEDNIYQAILDCVIDEKEIKKRGSKRHSEAVIRIKYSLSPEVFFNFILALDEIGSKFNIPNRSKQFEKLIEVLYGNKENQT